MTVSHAPAFHGSEPPNDVEPRPTLVFQQDYELDALNANT